MVTDFADTGDALFVNARPRQRLEPLQLPARATHGGAVSSRRPARQFRATYQWEVQERLARDYRCFVHFCTNGGIRWQQDHSLTPPTSQWQPGQTVSDGPWTITISAEHARTATTTG